MLKLFFSDVGPARAADPRPAGDARHPPAHAGSAASAGGRGRSQMPTGPHLTLELGIGCTRRSSMVRAAERRLTARRRQPAMLTRLAGFLYAHRRGVLYAAVAGAVIAGVFGGSVAQHLSPYGANDPATQSVQATNRFQAAAGRQLDPGVVALVNAATSTPRRRNDASITSPRSCKARRTWRPSSPTTRPTTPRWSPATAARPTCSPTSSRCRTRSSRTTRSGSRTASPA